MEAQFEDEKKPSEPAPQGQIVEESKAALEDVNVVIPEGMTVKSHNNKKPQKKITK